MYDILRESTFCSQAFEFYKNKLYEPIIIKIYLIPCFIMKLMSVVVVVFF